jgi:hypothetical protein
VDLRKRKECMEKITVEEIKEAILSILKRIKL